MLKSIKQNDSEEYATRRDHNDLEVRVQPRKASIRISRWQQRKVSGLCTKLPTMCMFVFPPFRSVPADSARGWCPLLAHRDWRTIAIGPKHPQCAKVSYTIGGWGFQQPATVTIESAFRFSVIRQALCHHCHWASHRAVPNGREQRHRNGVKFNKVYESLGTLDGDTSSSGGPGPRYHLRSRSCVNETL